MFKNGKSLNYKYKRAMVFMAMSNCRRTYACMHACMHACMYVCMYVFMYVLLRSISIYLYYLCIHNIYVYYIYTLHIYTIHIERFSPGVVPIPKCFSSLEMGTKGSPLQVGHRSSQTDVQYKI